MGSKSKIHVKDKKKFIRFVLICVLAVAVITAVILIKTAERPKEGEITYSAPADIQVSNEEMTAFRSRIGTDMDIKKAVLVLFETEDECIAFISEHGADKEPANAGEGIVPLMENGYCNIVGKHGIEEVFDTLSDGEYSKTPVLYSNLYCYLKRIGVDSPISNDEELKKLIQNEKFQEMRKKGD